MRLTAGLSATIAGGIISVLLVAFVLEVFWQNPGISLGPSQVDCRNLAVSQYRGVNFIDQTLTDRESGGPTLRGTPPSILERFQTLKDSGFNVVRVPMYWESYAKNRPAFLSSLNVIANVADQVGVCVFFDNQQWKTSSAFSINGTGGGFPHVIVGNRNNTLEGIQTFWDDYYNDAIFVNGINVWTWESYFLTDVVINVDTHKSVLGYELINEPAIFDYSQYSKLGDLQTFIATKLRMHTTKIIYFCKAEPAYGSGLNYVSMAYDPATEPNARNLVFDAHQYNDETPRLIPQYVQLSSQMHVPLIIGEWGAISQQQSVAYIATMKQYNLGWNVWVWDPVDAMYELNDGAYIHTKQYEWIIGEMPGAQNSH